ncbi:hypothetical protein [Anaerococcus rubeinfantis]|uniref:hypothetical protein n=1 Tax=Anaerococcus rubeinfantis TaxID=1720199 RepID=UPI00073F546F|nr:hypothetical protein [Anaerococcus rubeinfantis]
MDKVYVVIENDDGGSEGWGDYVTLVGIYTNEKEANDKVKELECKNEDVEDETDNIDPCHDCHFDNCDGCEFEDYYEDFDYDNFDDRNYMYNVYEIPLNRTVEKYLGGYAE